MGKYEVIVGNIGTVYDGNNPVEANTAYGEYKRQSATNYGRAAGESVAMFKDNDIAFEYCPDRGSYDWTD